MKTIIKKKLLYIASYFILAMLIEFVTFNVMGMGVFPQYYWMDVIILLAICAFVFLIPSFTAQGIIIVFLLALQSLISFVNEAMYNHPTMQNIFTVDMLNLVTAVGDVFSRSFVSYPFLIGLVAIVLIEVIFLVYLKRYKVSSKISHKFAVIFLLVFMLCEIFSGTIFTVVTNNLNTASAEDDFYLLQDDKDLFFDMNFSLKLKAYRKFGTFAFYFRNVANAIDTPDTTEIADSLDKIDAFYQQGEMSSANQNYTPYTGILKGKNIIMVMMESGEWFGIDPELTPTLYALSTQGVTANKYYSKNKTNQSEAISILGNFPTESTLQLLLTEDKKNGTLSYPYSLPNILKNSGYQTAYFHNNTQEFYDRGSTHTVLGFENLYFNEQMPELDGHNGKESFYHLDSDYKLFSSMANTIAPTGLQEPFFSFVTTITMHGNYDNLVEYATHIDNPKWDYTANTSTKQKADYERQSKIPFLCKYYDRITFEDFSEKFIESGIIRTDLYTEEELHVLYLRYKQYQASYMDLDLGLQALIEHLSESGLLEDTALVLFGDHNAYYHELAFSLKGYTTDQNYYQNLYTVPMFIYDGSLPLSVKEEDGSVTEYSKGSANPRFVAGKGNVSSKDGRLLLEKWTSPYDLAPTLMDLFGYSFNLNLYHGRSMFAQTEEEERSLFVSMESGMFNDKFFTLKGEEFYYFDTNGDIYVLEIIEEDVYCGKVGEERTKLSTQDEKYAMLRDNFHRQFFNFYQKQDVYENMFYTKFFSYKGFKNRHGEEYFYADVNNLIKEI